MIGFGAVASCTLPLLVRQIEIPFERITIVDAVKRDELTQWEKKGIKFIQTHITKGIYYKCLTEKKPSDR